MQHRAQISPPSALGRRTSACLALLGVVLVSLAVAGAALLGVSNSASAGGGARSLEVVMHLTFPHTDEASALTITLFLVDDGSDLSVRIAEGKAAMLARFPGAVELTAAEVEAQFNVSDNVRWPGLSANWSYNPADASSAMSAGATLAAITAGANGWRNAGGSSWLYNYSGQTATSTGCNGQPGAVPRDGQNVVGWGHVVSGFWGFTCWWRGYEKVAETSFDPLQEFDIIFENDPGVPYTPNVLKALALHEFGHALGLGHTEEALCPGHVMCAGSGATTLLTLTPDDIAGVISLYGVAPTPTPTAAPKPTPTPTPPLFPNGPKQRSFVPAVARD